MVPRHLKPEPIEFGVAFLVFGHRSIEEFFPCFPSLTLGKGPEKNQERTGKRAGKERERLEKGRKRIPEYS